MSSSDYPRDQAVRILTKVLSDGMALDEALVATIAEIGPGARGWLQEVCAGTLRWKGRLDLVIDSVSLKKKPSGWLRKILLVAAYQLIVQERTQPGVVVSETVSEIKRREGEAPAKFANAVLRKVADHAQQWREMAPTKGAEAAWASLPDWLWQRLVRQYGDGWARGYARASLERPVIWIRARRPDWKPEWAEPGDRVPGSFRLTSGGSVPDRDGFSEGEFFVQDISSQLLIFEVASEVRKALTGRSLTALDLCAAPGGKSAGLAWEGFEVIASDREEKRLALLRQTVSRVAPEVKVVPKAGLAELEPRDLVWVDAPCSGSGILRRHPDVRWLRREKELQALMKVQREVLEEGWKKTRSGGFLVYSVCSVLKEEGPEVLQAAKLDAHLVREWSLWPQQAPYGDGFWGALLRKP
ncbi:MAG: hypothetical protein NDJ90_03225 [Oligoflexia bacterium]|nr:hypothetical protein [Oligoflexia bacterium]